MVLSKREKYVAYGSAAAALLLALDYFLFSPYFAEREALRTDRDQVTRELTDATLLFARQSKLRKEWAAIQSGGLKSDVSEADSQAQHAVIDCADAAGVTLARLQPDRPVAAGPFQVTSFTVSGTGPSRGIVRLLWSLETASIPIRVNDVQITPHGKEGTDDLSVRMSVSTLCLPAPIAPAGGKPAGDARPAGTKG